MIISSLKERGLVLQNTDRLFLLRAGARASVVAVAMKPLGIGQAVSTIGYEFRIASWLRFSVTAQMHAKI